MASRHRKMSTLGTAVGEREEKVIELILNLQIIVLNRRLLEIRIDVCGDYRGTIPRVWRTGQHRADEVRERRGWRKYGKRMLQTGSCIGRADQILEELEGRIEAQGGGSSKEVDAVGINSIASSDNEISRFKRPPGQAYARLEVQLNRVIDKRRVFARIPFRRGPTVIVRQDESRSDRIGKSTGRW